ncbi:MAG: GHKL domain-containing protein [Nitrosopumilus sp.]|nr:GHKL domain-containing protein [Nitrosopumilus sp.]
MRKYLHRENSNNSDVDPMNAPTRTVFFTKNKPAPHESETSTSSSKNNLKSLQEIDKRLSDIFPDSLSEFADPEKFNKKLRELKKDIDKEIKMYDAIHKKLISKSESVKKSRDSLFKRQQELTTYIEKKSNDFENKNLEIIGEMSSKMAHDIRNPLTVLKSQVDLMKIRHKKHEDELMSTSLVRMESAILHITDQINDVLDFVRDPKLDLKLYSLKTLVDDSVNEVSFPEDVELNVSSKNCKVRCDATKMRVILTNIIHNAVQSVGTKGTVSLSVTDSNSDATISIEDSGPGIPEENLEKIFSPLFTTKKEGTGLGLASCKQIIEMHGGTIDVKNNPTTFTITLPKNKSS